MSLKELFLKTKQISNNFKTVNEQTIESYPEILKIIRLSLNMSVAEFSKAFGMYQQSRFERGLAKPTKRTIKRFLEVFEKYKKRCKFDFQLLEKRNKIFTAKHKGGIIVGRKTLFRQNDDRTIRLSLNGAQKGGLATIRRYGENHMATLAKRIQRGRENNSGFRSKAELMIARVLKQKGLEYEYEMPLNGYLPDFKIGNTLIEAMCTGTEEYWEKQKIKIEKLSKNYKMIIVTNNPNKIQCENDNVTIIKFSKYFDVLRNRIEEKLKFLS